MKQDSHSVILRGFFGLAFALLLVTVPAMAVVPPLPPATATFDVGSLHVQQFGSGSKTLIFIPGLACGPWAWAGEIAHFAPDYTVYALTLPGFDGQKAIAGDLYATFSRDFWNLLDEKHIAKPVVIGHSLGGSLAFLLATQHADRLGGVVSVEGLPVFPLTAMQTPEQRTAAAEQMSAAIAKETAAQFAASSKQFVLPAQITSQADVDAVAPLVGKSDPAAIAAWLKQDLSTDLRPDLPKATVPILLVSPFDAAIDGRYGAKNAADKAAFYDALLKGAPDAKVVSIEPSRHFVMFDQPQKLIDTITQFLGGLK